VVLFRPCCPCAETLRTADHLDVLPPACRKMRVTTVPSQCDTQYR
jgi:hypothetical protein